MLMIIAILSGSLIWLVMVLAHYNGWKAYDHKHNTSYRFNEGICADCVLFSVPKWLQRILRMLEQQPSM